MKIEEIYNRYYSELYRFAYQLSDSEADSKDLVQDLFEKISRQTKDSLNKIYNIRAWMYRIVYNEFVTRYRSGETHRRIENQLGHNESHISNDQESYEKNEKRRIVREQMEGLQEFDRTILLLYSDELSYEEISSVMNIKKSSVGSYINRARKKLVAKLKLNYHEMFE